MLSRKQSHSGGHKHMLQSIRDGDRLIVRLAGELDHYCAQTVRRELDALIADRSIRMLILDFTTLQFMDSSGIGVILGRYRQMRDRGGQVGVIHMNRHIARIFHMSGMDRVIRQLDKPQEAAQA
ncbi:MAG: anti-sigma F factor antagonist [Clostridia bacterium]|nr:anti-sigma F factor antagonist [Clostridia bacterium]